MECAETNRMCDVDKLTTSTVSSVYANANVTNVLALCGDSNSTQLGILLSEWDTRSALSSTEDIAVACFLLLMDIIAVCFNLLVIVISVRHRQSLNHSDAFVVSLAISDLGHPLLGYPMVIAASLHHRWIFGNIGCQVNGFIGFFFGVNSMLTLACLSLNRLLSIKQPNAARNHGQCIATSLILVSPCYALFWALCPLFGWGAYDLEPYHTSCTLKWDYPETSYVTASFIGCLAVPAAIMCLSYGYISLVTITTGKNTRRWTRRDGGKTWSKNELRLFKMTVTMCSVFILVWSPYAIVAMIRAYNSNIHIPIELSTLPALTAKTSHVLDPILYCALNRKFRRFVPFQFKHESSDPQCTQQGNVSTTLALNNLLGVKNKITYPVTSPYLHSPNSETVSAKDCNKNISSMKAELIKKRNMDCDYMGQ